MSPPPFPPSAPSDFTRVRVRAFLRVLVARFAGLCSSPAWRPIYSLLSLSLSLSLFCCSRGFSVGPSSTFRSHTNEPPPFPRLSFWKSHILEWRRDFNPSIAHLLSLPCLSEDILLSGTEMWRIAAPASIISKFRSCFPRRTVWSLCFERGWSEGVGLCRVLNSKRYNSYEKVFQRLSALIFQWNVL